MMSRRWWAALCVVQALAIGAVSLVAGLPADQDTQTFRSGVEVSLVEVSVVDRNRRPVRGLTAGDFAIRVNGQAQPIVSVSEVALPNVALTGPRWLREGASDVVGNDLADTRLFIVIMDDANTPPEPWMVRNGKQAARRYIEGLAPNDLVSVIFTWNNSKAQELTRDHAKLIQAIDAFTYGPPVGPGISDQAREALVSAVRTLSEVPQFRTAVVLVSPGGRWLEEARRRLEPTFATSRVPVYSVSILGLRPSIGLGPSGIASIRPSNASPGTDALKNIADRSSGFAITDTNDPLPAIDAIVRENNAYYVIGYRATYPTTDGRRRRLEVRVNRDRVDVFPSVRTIESSAPSASQPTAPLAKAIQAIVPDADVPLHVAVAPFRAMGGDDRSRDVATVVIALHVAPQTGPAPAAHTEVLDVETRAFDNQGLHEIALTHHTAHVTLGPDASPFEVRSRLDLKPGHYNLRFATRSGTGTTASVYTDVVVPDFADDVLSLSGVVIDQAPPLPGAPDDRGDKLLPFAPTASRVFTTQQQVRAFLRVYQGGRRALQDVALSTRIVDERDAAAFETNERLAAERFDPAHRSADYLFGLPVSRLTPGRYLLRVEASLGRETVARNVRFQIQ